jgi:Fe-S cluster assembly protein SufB/Fe-S cluster assembly protein SufD
MSYQLPNFSLKEIFENKYQLNEVSILTEYRKEAFDYYNKLNIEVSPLYIKNFDISGLDLANAKITYEEKYEADKEILGFLESISNFPYALIINGKVSKINIPEIFLKTGLRIDSIKNYFSEEEKIKEIFKYKTISNKEDKFAAFNDAFFLDGLFIYIPKGIQLKVPIRIINLINNEGIVSVVQNFIVADNDSKFVILEENFSKEDISVQSLHSQNLNVYLNEGSELEYITVCNFNEKTSYFSNRRVVCNKDSRISWISGYLGGLITRIKTDNFMKEQGAFSNTIELIVGNLKQRFDITSYLTHAAPYTQGVALSRAVLKDESRSILKGLIKITENARNSNAYLEEHAMILNRGARADSIPGLEIANNEVRATHSASVAQIDEEQIFYLMSRGLSENEAKKLLTLGFFDPLLAKILSESIKEKIKELIEDKIENRRKKIEEKLIITEEIKEFKELSPEKMFETHYKYRK